MRPADSQTCFSRRAFIRQSMLLPSALLCTSALASSPQAENTRNEEIRYLFLANVHSGEHLDVAYCRDGAYMKEQLNKLDHFMRDYREDKIMQMDRKLYDFMYELYSVLGTTERIHVLSAYRTAATNTALSQATSDVAKRSFHVSGQAIDFFIPGVDNKTIQREARRLMLGGVGYYINAGFVHIDTGYPRHWVKA